MKRFFPYIAALITVIFWASAFPAVKYSLKYYSPESLMLLRFIIASITLFIYSFYKKVKLPDKKDLKIFLIAGFIGIFFYMWLFNSGTKLVTSGISSFIIASSPVFTLLMSIIFLKERSTIMSLLGMVISLLGLFLVASTQVTAVNFNFGTLLLIAAAICNGIYNVLQRKILKKYSSVQSSFFCVLVATVFMLIFTPNLVKEIPNAPYLVNLIIIYLGVFPAAIAYMLWSYSLSKVKKTIYTTSFLYLSPFISIVLAYFWLNETVSMVSFIGGIIIIIGLLVTNLPLKVEHKINLKNKM